MNDMPLIAELTPEAYQALFALTMDAMPHEVCGVLTGLRLSEIGSSTPAQAAADVLRVTGVLPVKNAAARPETQFAFDPHDWVRAVYDMQKNRQSLVGFFHSHPGSPPVPSKADHAGFPFGAAESGSGTSYWILSPDALGRTLAIRPYWVRGESFLPLMLAQVRV
ncbi:Proteasome lid subunit RPN8/RPN11, contains Jab1/MPN metalloenzyme (JAMM) motif [Paenibacillus sp. UNC496MF]|uniref:Mov34/MPN/PAD-1 family protein n=1 Tax=Paenibacillus sp. UNC496MF TaxID=1502753 RepID=UPI0008EF12D3|nr:M67 family metallopeptidase [Paenibacillus sp. UNC496MF]SFJ08981.1 Proteasome lid subunit RPN8/RPN11, contains Jab1/MPN metalloenzyme (JAMM) motif [Paenibacillus sp. UNC496MF]